MPPRNLLVIAMTIVVSLACYSVASKNRYANLFAEAIEVIDRQSLKQVPREQLFVSAMEGMLKDLDEHSMYISGEMYKMFDEEIRQEFGGVGMYVEMNPKTKRLTVLAPMPGTPAFEVGLRSGDQIIAIDGKDVDGKTRRDAIKLLRGPVGKMVKLQIERGDERLTKILKRAVIPIASVHGDFRTADGKWKYVLKEQPQIGYIRLLQFGEKSGEEFAAALKEMGRVDGLIIDLRNNSGGLLDVAIDICDAFLPSDKTIVSTRSRNSVLDREIFSTSKLEFNPGIPICVLVNRNSASASEVVAGCLQDHGRAILVGEQSWGKGTVQNVIPIQRGESALKLTTSSYWRPSGEHIDRYDDVAKETNRWGVHPNPGFEVEQTEEEVFNNIRARSIRELQGLLTPEEVLRVTDIGAYQTENQPAESNPDSDSPAKLADDTPSKSEGPGEDSPEGESVQPYVDRPLHRAIEYFRSLQEKQLIAA
jgi:carboxyl-terminal processing protease